MGMKMSLWNRIRRSFLVLTCVASLAPLCGVALAAGPPPRNLLEGGSFETGWDGMIPLLARCFAQRKAKAQLSVVSTTAAEGAHSLRVALPEGFVRVPDRSPVLLHFRPVKLEGGKKYTFSVCVKNDPGGKARWGMFTLHRDDVGARARIVSEDLGDGWTRLRRVITAKPRPGHAHWVKWRGESARYLYRPEIRLTKAEAGGVAYIDGLQIVEGESASPYGTTTPVETGIECDRECHLFYVNQRGAARALIYNPDALKRLTFSYTLSDGYFERDLTQEEAGGPNPRSVALAAGGKNLRVDIPLPPLPRGFYRIRSRVADARGRALDEEEFIWGVITEGKPEINESSFFGTHLGMSDSHSDLTHSAPPNRPVAFPYTLCPVRSQNVHDVEAFMRVARDVGMKWIRVFNGYSPLVVCQDENKFNFKYTDEFTDLALSHGLSVYPIFQTWPTRQVCQPAWMISKRRTGNRQGGFLLKEKAVAKYVYELVKRYRGRITHWEVCNEPSTVMTAEEFVSLEKVTYDAVKRANPDAVLVGMGSTNDYAGAPHAQKDIMKDVEEYLKVCAWGRFDKIYTHYAFRCGRDPHCVFEFVARMNAYTKRFGGKVYDIWNTECGRYGPPSYERARIVGKYETSGRTAATAREQADDIIGQDVTQMAAGFKNHLFFHMPYTIANGAYAMQPTLMNCDLTPRQSLIAYDAMTAIMEGARFVREVPLDRDYLCFIFERAGVPIAFLWNWGSERDRLRSNDHQTDLRLALSPDRVRLLNIMGGEIPPRRDRGGLRVRVSSSPVYLLGRGATADEIASAVGSSVLAQKDRCAVEFVRLRDGRDGRPALAVGVRNKTNVPLKGTVALKACPRTWRFARAETPFGPAAGRLSVRSLALAELPLNDFGAGTGGDEIRGEVRVPGQALKFSSTVRVLASRKAKGQVVIDGDLSEWKGARPVTMGARSRIVVGAGKKGVWSGPRDLSAQILSQWDDAHLYFAVRVTDDRVVLNRRPERMIYQGDCVELFFDTRLGEDFLAPFYNSDDVQVLFAPAPKGVVKTSVSPYGGGRKVRKADLRAAFRQDRRGYVMEVAIPLSCLPELRARVGRLIGFDVALDDLDSEKPGEIRKIQMAWSGGDDNCTNPTRFGVLVFAE